MFITEEILIYLLLGSNIVLLFWIIRLEIKTRNIEAYKEQKKLKSQFQQIESKLENLCHFEEKTRDNFRFMQNKLQNSVQNVEIMRFNPFKSEGIGGDQSFAIAFLNKKGDGAVMSSLYARDKVSVFAKPIENWQSKYELSEEENIVLEKVKG